MSHVNYVYLQYIVKNIVDDAVIGNPDAKAVPAF